MSRPAPADRRLRVPAVRARRVLYAALVLGLTGLGAWMMLGIVGAGGVTLLEVGILLLFVPTFGWIGTAFWNAVIGFVLLLLRRDPASLRAVRAPPDPGTAIAARTALVMPVHNEDPDRVMSGLAAMIGSLEATGRAGHFDVHLLSDTTDDDIAAAEEAAWHELRRTAPRPGRLRYRRRASNEGRKAGNIADFCVRWGGEYDFMVVLDADSVMTGGTLVELVRTMEENPRVGLIQTVPIPAFQETLFGRLVQFAAALYSPLLAAGQSFWHGESANYWGHNAIVRIEPFRRHARLPVLPGRPPLGGAVLSHDFVEGALLRRAGWHVHLRPLLQGSYEEVPANVPAYATRDRRWAQGSIQHLRLIRAAGLHPISRLHFALGAMGYLSSVLWLLLLLASTAYVLVPALSGDTVGGPLERWAAGSAASGVEAFVPLLGLTAIVLFLPKGLGLLLALLRRRRELGGAGRLVASAFLEAAFSVVLAPVMMMYHTWFVVGIAIGRDVEWSAQARTSETLGWPEATRATWGIAALGGAWALVTLAGSPGFFLWMSPIFVGLLLVTPLVRVTSSARWGGWLRDRGLLRVGSERRPPVELVSAIERGPDRTHMFAGHQATGTERAKIGGMHEVERGLFELRRGRPLFVGPSRSTGGEGVLFTAVEGLDRRALQRLRSLASGPIRLVVTPRRARAMGIGSDPERPSPVGGVSVGLNGESAEQVLELSSAPGPFDASGLDVRSASEAESVALSLIRAGRLLPALVAVRADPARVPELRDALDDRAILRLSVEEVSELLDPAGLGIEVTYVSDARVPLHEAESASFSLFRETNGLLEHVAVLIGERDEWPDPVPVRLHSACLTGDLFGSLRCDCGDQLRGSLRYFAARGGGVLLYLQQEGRGIGLGNKLRAYALQQDGLDTVDADHMLGFGADERGYHAAVEMLKHLGIERVQLLTNNPDKVAALERGGIEVVDRKPLHGTLNRHNLPYVRAKVQRAGHWLGEMLHGTFPGS